MNDNAETEVAMTITTHTTHTARSVYAVRLDATTGALCEGFDRLCGTATTREEAAAVARAAGHAVVTDGGLIEVAPGEVVGEERDVWAVTVAG